MAYADLAPEGDRITVLTQWNEKDLVKLIPGARNMKVPVQPGTAMWKLPLSWASMVALRGVFGQHFLYSDTLAAWTWEVRVNRIEPSLKLRDLLEWPEEGFPDGMYPFQRADVMFMETAGSGLLGNEAGTGKTISVLVYLGRLGDAGHPALIICPNSVKHHWRKKAALWRDLIYQWDPYANVYIVEKGTVSGRKILAKAKQDPKAVVIINIEAAHSFSKSAPYGSVKMKRCKQCDPNFGDDIPASRCEVHPKELNDFGFKVIIMDEIHRIGQVKTLQTRAIWAIAHDPSIEHRWGLTGTPDNMKRLWSMMHAVAPDEYPVKSSWMDRYALQSWNAYGGLDVVGIRPDTRDELYRILDPRFRRMIKDIVLPWLPPQVHTVRDAEMTTSQAKMYKELEEHLHTQLPDGELFVAQNHLVARTRMMQFASSSIKVEKIDPDDVSTWKVTLCEPSPKLDVMEEVLDELDSRRPFVVSAESRQLIALAAARLDKRHIRYSLIVGGMSSQEQEQATEDLKKGMIQAILFTIKAGSVGLDMTGADTHIHLQRSWSLIENIQTNQRTHRPGAEVHESINHIDIITKGTNEEKQVERLLEKLEQLEEITRDRQAIGKALTGASLSREEIMKLNDTIQQLAVKEHRILANDDLDSYRLMEEE